MQKLTEAKFLEWLYTDLPIFHRDYVSADDDGLTMIDYEGLLGCLVNIYEEIDCDKEPLWWLELNRMMDYCEDHMKIADVEQIEK